VVMVNGLSIRMGRPRKTALGQKYADYRRMTERTARRSTCRRKLSARGASACLRVNNMHVAADVALHSGGKKQALAVLKRLALEWDSPVWFAG
jgi:hypothetical protein